MTWVLASGDVVTHYRVLSPLGSGGMGQVYLAEDVRLGRRLAIKVLSPRAVRDEGRLWRFEREARTISTLNHPNILTIYDIGHVGDTRFLATEYIDGVTLRTVLERGRVDIRHAIEIAIQVAQALAAAHDAGVIHRDLKPENIMIRVDGYVKVLDFGLAKLTDREAFAAASDAATQLPDTRDGVVMGTCSYMAPEQIRGTDVDPRADLFAFGVLLYEMLAGEPPFKGETAADIVSAVLLREPEPFGDDAGIPDELDRIVTTALRKSRDERYQSCRDMLRDLRQVMRALEPRTDAARSSAISSSIGQTADGESTAVATAYPAPDTRRARRRRARRVINSLAVLPLVNRSRDEELDYFSDGLTESLINNLSQLPRLRVMARSTVFRYKGQYGDPLTIGRDLNVQAVLTGHVLQRGNDFSVGAELVDVADGSQLWGTLLNRRPSDVFTLQAEISEELTNALRLHLTRDEKNRLIKPPTVNADAYQLYLRGRYLLNKRSGEDLKNARTLFERAVTEDPRYALAYAGLADCCSLTAVSFRTSSVGTLIEEARTAALRALELDDGLAAGHASLAFIKFRFDWDWAGAEAEFARALHLNPGHAPSRQWYAMYLASRSRFDAALDEMKRALELDPLSLIIQAGIGRILHFAGRLDEAILQYEHVLETNPDFAHARIDLALTRLARGDVRTAREELQRAEELLGSGSTILLIKGLCAVREGRLEEGRATLSGLTERYARGEAGADDLALMAAAIGDWESAVAWLTEACTQRSPFLGYVDVEPAMAPLRLDPGCRLILQSHGFGAGV